MARPLPQLAFLYLVGILLGRLLEPRIILLFGAGFVLLIWAWAREQSRGVCLAAALVVTGWTGFLCRTQAFAPGDLRRVCGAEAKIGRVAGEVAGIPLLHTTNPDRPTVSVPVRVRQWDDGTGVREVEGIVMVRSPGPLEEARRGVRVEVEGVLRTPAGAAARGCFDYRYYLWTQGIFYEFEVGSTNDWVWCEGASSLGRGSAERFRAWGQQALARGLPVEDEYLHLIWAMVLGWRTGLRGETREIFMQSGTLHIFAVSGLHIALIATILTGFFRVVQVPRRWCIWLILPGIWFYTAAVGWQASAVRSAVMTSVVMMGWALERPPDLVNSLSGAALILLAWDPLQLFQAGFQLSFSVVLTMAVLIPQFLRWQEKMLEPDPFLPADLRPRWKQLLDKPSRYLSASFATSLAAWIGSLPLIAYYFFMITPVSLLANMLIVPLSGVALTSALASLVTAGVLPWASELFNHATWFFMVCLVHLSDWFAGLPGAYFYVPAPSVATVLAYALLLGCLVKGWFWRPGRRSWAWAALTVFSLAWLGSEWRRHGQTEITVLPSTGETIYIDGSGRAEDLLIETGRDSTVTYVLKPFLRASGVNQLRKLVFTHGDLNHFGGAGLMLTNFGVQQVFTSGQRFRSAAYRQLMAELDSTPGLRQILGCGDTVGGWRVLHPETSAQFSRADDGTLVLWKDFEGTSVLLLSDLGSAGARALWNRWPDLRADIVIAGVPSQDETLPESWREQVQPGLVIVSSSDSTAHRATPKTRARLSRWKVPVLYTAEAGAVEIVLRDGAWRVRTAHGVELRGR